MKQIIVNVSGLTIEEKQRVNKALAKITGFKKSTSNLVTANWMYAPSLYTDNVITYSDGNRSNENKEPTHTPQQVLEMAGMAAKRKVRKDFDPKKSISVDVSNCTEEEKKEVQQAFYDVGIKWIAEGTEYRHLDAVQYSNTNTDGVITKFCMYGSSTKGCNMNPEEFFSYVYEPVQQGHVHAELMALYAEDAKTTDKPWRLWEFKGTDGNWMNPTANLFWVACTEYRRKPKTHIVNGVEIPDLRLDPKKGDRFYLVDPTEPEFTNIYTATNDTMWAERGLCYEPTEEGKKAAIFHAKAWLGEGIYFDSK